MTIHSSLTPRFQPLAETVLGKSRADEKQARRSDEARELKAAYALVDARDDGRCRVCGKRCSTTAIAMLDRAERHHMAYRSRGGEHDSANILTLCKKRCHEAVHVLGTMRVSGDADARDERGKFNGVKCERWIDGAGWAVEKWI